MIDKLNHAIHNLRATVLIRKLAMHGKHISKDDAIAVVSIHTDNEAFNSTLSTNQNTHSSWLKDKWSRLLNLLPK
jgi:hypothetical protein